MKVLRWGDDEGREAMRSWIRAWLNAQTQAHEQIVAHADEVNLRRVEFLGATIAVMNVVHVIALWLFYHAEQGLTPARMKWQLGLIITHACMGVLMAATSLAAMRLRRHVAPCPRLNHALTWGAGALGLWCSTVIAVVDQWVTPNITPFVASTFAIAFLLLIRPRVAALLYLLNYILFAWALGLTQADEAILFSNRLGGIGNSLLGWGLSVVLWRSFSSMTLAQLALNEANQELERRHKILQESARRDALTGLLNRAAAIELGEQLLSQAQREGSVLALMILDVDYFKRINDVWGHPAGDFALEQLARVLERAAPEGASLARLGGEEFVVLVDVMDRGEAERAAQRLRQQVESATILWQDTPLKLTVSIGVTTTPPQEALEPFARYYAQADAALYEAKAQGRNTVSLASASRS